MRSVVDRNVVMRRIPYFGPGWLSGCSFNATPSTGRTVMRTGIQFFWDTTLRQWVIGFRRFETSWCPRFQGSKCPTRTPRIDGNVTIQELYTFMFPSVAGIPLGHLDHWRRGHQDASKYRDPITQWRSFSYIPANTSELDVVVVICGVGSAESWLPITRRVNPTMSTGILLTP